MAVVQMAKVMIVTHRSQASDLLEALQREGICHILNADEAAVTRDFPDLAANSEKPRDINEMLGRLGKCIAFLGSYAEHRKGIGAALDAALAPRTVVDEQSYERAVSDGRMLDILASCEKAQAKIDKLNARCDTLESSLEMLGPWSSLQTPVEELGRLQKTTCLAGVIPAAHFDNTAEQIAELGAAVQQIAATNNKFACLVVCLKENTGDVQKLLRSAEFENVNFESMTGTVTDLIDEHRRKLAETHSKLQEQFDEARSLSGNLLKLQILYDHYTNLLDREQARAAAPATEKTVILECWVRQHDYQRLEKIVSAFAASSVSRIERAETEEVPVEIENKKGVRPFEVITRLYGMPRHFEVDPTVFLAPFFALFFGLCLTDAGYGLIILAVSIYFIMKMQGDKKLISMLAICSVATVIAGALMGGWFGDAVQKFVPKLEPLRQKVMWFDPMQYPLRFFTLSLVLGYIQIMAGLLIAFLHDLKRRLYVAAICDRLTWLIMLNCIVAFALAKTGKLPGKLSFIFGFMAMASAVVIFLFSQREGGWPARLGMGFYNLFSAIFYIGDVLSYLRLMALGLVTAGLAMAVNQIATLAYRLPVAGIVLAALIIVGGHLFNLGINALGAFVHSLRLQYAEFFPKFFVGGGLAFKPLEKNYRHIYVKKT